MYKYIYFPTQTFMLKRIVLFFVVTAKVDICTYFLSDIYKFESCIYALI